MLTTGVTTTTRVFTVLTDATVTHHGVATLLTCFLQASGHRCTRANHSTCQHHINEATSKAQRCVLRWFCFVCFEN